MMSQQESLPQPQPLPPPEKEDPFPQKQERSRIIQIMLQELHPLSQVLHPQFVAAKSLIFGDLQNFIYSIWYESEGKRFLFFKKFPNPD